MPNISLVVCLHRELDSLERLLNESAGLFDDLVVVHDGPENREERKAPIVPAIKPPAIDFATLKSDSTLPAEYRIPNPPASPGSMHELVLRHGGRFFEGPRCFQQEPHWPFAWSQARHDWILRLDADEFPSEEMKVWLRDFKTKPTTDLQISGFTCVWPLWNGRTAVTKRWPAGRNFFFHRNRVRFFGMVGQVPIPDGKFKSLPLMLCHQPNRKSYGLRNILLRKQGGRWRRVIAESLNDHPAQLPRWRWSNDDDWPEFWRRLREHPVSDGLYFFVQGFLSTLRDQWRIERTFMPLMALATPLHHFLIGLLLLRHRKARSRNPGATSG